jgi:hypothetical protein
MVRASTIVQKEIAHEGTVVPKVPLVEGAVEDDKEAE